MLSFALHFPMLINTMASHDYTVFINDLNSESNQSCLLDIVEQLCDARYDDGGNMTKYQRIVEAKVAQIDEKCIVFNCVYNTWEERERYDRYFKHTAVDTVTITLPWLPHHHVCDEGSARAAYMEILGVAKDKISRGFQF